MKNTAPQAVKLSEYQAPDFSVAEIESLTPGAQVQVKDRVVLK